MKIEIYDEKHCDIIATLPAYAGLEDDGPGIIGLSNDGAYIIKRSVEIINYQHASSETVPRVEDYTGAYSFIRDQVDLLRGLPESDDLGRMRPSQYSIEIATQSVFRMLEASNGLPLPLDVSTDRDGAIRIIWEKEPRSLELVSPFEQGQRPYIYFSDDSQYRIAHDFSAPRLARLIGWLKGEVAAFPQ